MTLINPKWREGLHVLVSISFLFSMLMGNQFAKASDQNAYYYSFDKKIYGKLDTSILAVQIPKGMTKNEFDAPVAAVEGKFLSEDVPYAKAFQQEGISFIKLNQPANEARFSEFSSAFTSVSSTAHVGHPFFLEGEKFPMIVTDELVVRFKPDVTKERIEEYSQQQGVDVVKKNPHVPTQYLLRVTPEAQTNALEMANRYQESGLTVFAQPNFLLHIGYHHIPTDTEFSNQWHLHNVGTGTMTADADIDAVEAWDNIRGDPNVIVAVIDGGFEITHSDLDGNIITNIAEVRNGVDDDGNGYVDDINGWSFVGNSDDVSNGLWPYHGQSVAGLVAAEENGTGVVGVCPQCSLLVIANTFNVNELADAFYYARDRGADIITNSWGATGSTLEQPVLITAINDTANGTQGGRGIPIFFATGNDGGATVAYPARDPNTIAVGGSDCSNVRYQDSQYGPEISVVSTTRQTDGSCGLVTTDLSDGVTTTFGGTSGATPVAAGIAGLLLSVNSNLTRQQVQDILEGTAEKVDASAANYGIDGFSTTHGYGRVNAHRATVPTVKISVSPEEVKRDDPFSVTVTGSAPFGLQALWWFGQGTGINHIDQAHWQNISTGESVYSYTWNNVKIDKKGIFTLAANARDVRYPNPPDGQPHQASEGSGIASTQIEVTPSGAFVGLTAMGISYYVIGLFSLRRLACRGKKRV